MLRTLALLFIAFIICISGSNTLIFLAVTGAIDFSWINSPLFQVSTALYFADSIFNPFIFGLKYNRFQHGLRRFLGRIREETAKTNIHAIAI